MRFILAAILICALGLPSAQAKSSSGAKSTAPGKQSKARQSRGAADLGGIHPLVGSGGY